MENFIGKQRVWHTERPMFSLILLLYNKIYIIIFYFIIYIIKLYNFFSPVEKNIPSYVSSQNGVDNMKTKKFTILLYRF